MFTEFNKIYSMEIDLKNLEVVHNSKALYSNVDLNTSTMMVKLSMDNKSLNLTDTSIIAYIKAGKNNNVTMERCNILEPTEGIIGLDFKSSSLQAGTNTFFLEIKSNNGEIINSPLITYKVVELFDVSEGTEGDNDTTILRQLISEVEVIKESVETLRDEIIADEEIRKSNESTRIQNEQQRVNSETSRETAETSRTQSESDRVDAENTRVSNETTRVENEKSRVSAESGRVSSESERVLAETKRAEDFEKIKTDNNTLSTDLTKKVDSKIAEIESQNETFKQNIHEQYDSFIGVVEEQILNSKTDYFGKEHLSVEERLNEDFDNVHQRINDSSLLEYEGCNISADNTYYGITKDTVIKGRTLQNLLDEDTFYNSSKWQGTNGYFSLIDNRGYVTLTARGGFVNGFIINNGMFKPSSKYTIVMDIKENSLSKEVVSGFVLCGNSVDEIIAEMKMSSNCDFTPGIKKIVVTTKPNISGCPIGLRSFIYKGISTGKIVYRVMILEGDHTNTPIEELPYGEGIYSVGEKTKNLCDNSKNKLMDLNKDTGLEYASTACVISDFILVNKDYVCSKVDINNKFNLVSYRYYDADKTYLGINRPNFYPHYVRLRALKLSDVTNISLDEVTFQLEEGTVVTPYEEYFDKYRVMAKSFGKNMAKNRTVIDLKHSTGRYVTSDNGGHASPSSIEYLPKGTYILSLENFNVSDFGDAGIYIWKNDKNVSNVRKVPISTPFEINNGDIGVTWYGGVPEGQTINSIVGTSVQIEEVATNQTKPTQYEPYKEDVKTYYLDEPLRSLPNGVSDTIEENKIIRRVGKMVLNGSEDWVWDYNPSININTVCCYITNFKNSKKLNSIMCDRLSYLYKVWDLDIEGVSNHSMYDWLFINVSRDKLPEQSVDGFKKWLSENPTIVNYQLMDAITTPLDNQIILPNKVTDEVNGNIVIRKVGRMVLDGSENWTKGPDSQNLGDTMYFANFDYDSLAKINTDSLSNMFPKGSTWKLDTECHEFIGSGEGRLRLRILKSKLETQDVDGFKQWLSENPTTIWYELSEPYEEYTNTPPLKLKSFDTRTYITSTNTLLPVIKAKIPSNVQAVVSNLRNNNNALTKEVSVLSLENKELKDTNDVQDVLIDTTMLATDEMFTMIEPLLSQVAETLQLEREVSKMVDMYVAMVMRGLKTIDEVPSRYREQVKEILGQLEK